MKPQDFARLAKEKMAQVWELQWCMSNVVLH
jgi:hypothetical protein